MSSPNPEQFIRLFLANEHRFFGLITTMVPNQTDAEDVLQETSTAMWRKFETFQEGTNFAAWGLKFARLQCLKYYEKKRYTRLRFDDDLLETIATDAISHIDQLDDRRTALRLCLKKLPPKHRQLIQMRYEQNVSTKAVAQQIGLTIHGVYKAMHRVHDALLQCIQRTLSKGGSL